MIRSATWLLPRADIRTLLFAFFFAAFLAACATPAERRATYIADAQSVCTAAGVPPESPSHAECTIRIYQQQQEARDDADRPLVLRALKMAQPLILAAIKSLAPAPAAPIVCTTRTLDDKSVTTCHPQAADDVGSDGRKKNR
jgi:hypothetical protein